MDPAIRKEMEATLPRLRRFARALTGSAADADDLTQAACERAMRNIEKWTPGTRLDSWMFRIAQNLHRNGLREREVRIRHRDHLAAAELGRVQPDAGEASAELAQVRDFMRTLPEEQRAVLLLVAVEGRGYAETAEILGAPIGTVTSRLARARQALKEFRDG